jgi:hypothetical protein
MDMTEHISTERHENEKPIEETMADMREPKVDWNSGYKYDEGKPRMDLLDPKFLEGIAKVLTFGAKKYDDRNWENGINYGRCYGAAQRHLNLWWSREKNDDETGFSHLYHAACCLMFLAHYEYYKMDEWDDRSNYFTETPKPYAHVERVEE